MNSKETVTKLLSSSNFTLLNNSLIKALQGDLVQAFMLSHLVGMYTYFSNAGMISSDGWFYQTIDDIEENCGISAAKQRRALSLLEKAEIIGTRLVGSPPKRHFKVYTDKIVEMLGNVNAISSVPVVPSGIVSKQEFYTNLNTALHTSWTMTKTKLGSIPVKLGFFMYIFCSLYNNKTSSEYEWTPKSYGQLRHWFRTMYTNKKFDYRRFMDGIGYGVPDFQACIDYDKRTGEYPVDKRIYADHVTIYDRTGHLETY